jgi:signal transduction histidine kinase
VVARPVRALVAMSKRIARGDLSTRLHLRQKDELTTMAQAMNAMSAQLESALEQLRHAERLGTVGKLAAGVAHELGTPLNVVGGSARMIASGELEGDEALEAARTIQQQTQGMSAIIRQLLDFARRRSPEKAQLDLGEVTERTLDLLRPLAEKRGVQLQLERSDGAVAEIDPGQIGQVITNLVMNAIQALPRGGQVAVRLDGSEEQPPADVGGSRRDFVRVAIHDDGTGIAPDVLAHVFEPFFTTKAVGEGTGLGLSVSYGLVREHGGWISVESAPNQGSTFTVHLPREA